jgi:phosphoribosyl-ATP pyrophosphohydrolase
MNKMQEQVEAFHRKFGHVIGTKPAISRPELRVKLIREEAKETCDAIEVGDLIEAIDGICDLLYVTIGTAVEFGIDIQPFFDEVHRSNMAKEGGGKDADGKTLKPSGWAPPDIKGTLELQSTMEYTIVSLQSENMAEPLRVLETHCVGKCPHRYRLDEHHPEFNAVKKALDVHDRSVIRCYHTR